MLGTDIALNHYVALDRHQELIAESMRQNQIDLAYEAGRISRRGWLADTRAALATALLRAGSWLMPEDGAQPVSALELRPGR